MAKKKELPKRLKVKLTPRVAAESILFELSNNKRAVGCKNVGHCVLAHAAGYALGEKFGSKDGFYTGDIQHDSSGFEVVVNRKTYRYSPINGKEADAQEDVTSAFDHEQFSEVLEHVGETFEYRLGGKVEL